MEWNTEENFSMEWNMEEKFSMEWNMEWKIFSMEFYGIWNGRKLEFVCFCFFQYGINIIIIILKNRLPFHSIPYLALMSSEKKQKQSFELFLVLRSS